MTTFFLFPAASADGGRNDASENAPPAATAVSRVDLKKPLRDVLFDISIGRTNRLAINETPLQAAKYIGSGQLLQELLLRRLHRASLWGAALY
jgi:hypothetical protein